MKYEMVRNLEGGEILGEYVVNGDGKVLLPKGTKLTKGYINLLKQNLIYFVHIEEDTAEVLVGVDEKVSRIKETIAKELPSIFDELVTGKCANISAVQGFVDSIVLEKDININLYEINQYDNYTYIHCVDTGIMSILLGNALGLSVDKLRRLGMGAMLHDVGKTLVPDEITNKRGELTPEEYEEMKKHPIYGYNILKKAGIEDLDILSCAISHHERIDGTGYPFGVKGDKLSIFPRIIGICDVFTAICANRSYRSRFNPNEGYEYVISGIGTLFDSEIVQKFKETFNIYPLGCHVKLSNGSQGIVVGQNKGFPDRPVIRLEGDGHAGEINLFDSTKIVIEYIIK